jgi:hypothetical protein
MDYQKNIINSGKSIYNTESINDKTLYIPNNKLEQLLNNGLIGLSLIGLPLRTRSKFVKSLICKALCYPVPESFKRTKPDFPAQNLDVYTQKSLNVQIWNETIDLFRRYAFIQVDQFDKILKVKVISGEQLAILDRTGTLTTKYQAMMPNIGYSMLFSSSDTLSVQEWCGNENIDLSKVDPTSVPRKGLLLPIKIIYEILKGLEGISIPQLDALQERNRGAILHKIICEQLGFEFYADNGSYPDILNQLLEIKLQTSPTIDLGVHNPNDNKLIISLAEKQFFSKDIRYAIISGHMKDKKVFIKHFYLISGEDFSKHISLFGGKVINSKLQIPLPNNFFD